MGSAGTVNHASALEVRRMVRVARAILSGELGENDSHLRQAGYSCVHRCAPRCAKL